MPDRLEAAPLRCLIDTMIFDAIVEEPGLLEAVDRLTSAGEVELLADTVSVAQVAAAPASYHRRQLRRVRVLVVPPADTDPVLPALAASTGVGEPDALIAAAARAQGVPLVTEDADLRRAAAVLLPDLVLWTWGGDLRPRLLTLAAGLPPRRRR